MKKLIYSAALAALMAAGTANAQISFGPEAGLNITSMGGKSAGKDFHTGSTIGARVGGVVDIGITENIFVRPGLQFSLMGGKEGDYGSDVAVNLTYIHVPINVLYKLGKPGANRLYFGLVPYFGYCIGGKGKTPAGDVDLEIGNDEAKDDFKPLDFGLGAKVGYEIGMGFYVDASFLQGISNVVTGGNADNKLTNRNISIGAGYFFGRDK